MLIEREQLSPMERIEYNEKRPKFIQKLMDEFEQKIKDDPLVKSTTSRLSPTAGAIHIKQYQCSWVDADPINNCYQLRFCRVGTNLHDHEPDLELKANYIDEFWDDENGNKFTNSQLVEYCVTRLKEMVTEVQTV